MLKLTPFMQYSQPLKTKVHYFHGELPPIIRWSTKESQALLSFISLRLCLAAFRKKCLQNNKSTLSSRTV